MEEMKDSGIEWIGNIPKDWYMDKLKYHLKRNEPKNPGNQQVLSLYREYGIIPKDSRDDNHNVTSEDTSKYKYVQKGNFVINKMKAWQGSVAVSDFEGIVSPAYYVYEFTDEKFDKRFFHYLLRSCYKDEFRRLSGGIREGQWDLPSEALNNMPIVFPEIATQERIAQLLDSKCEEIDKLLAEIQAEIDTLKEYKRSVIMEKVTKGLEPNVEMKNSGIEWVGEIPYDWNKIKIKYATIEIKKGISPDYTEAEKTKIINQATFSKGFFDIENIRFANDDFNKSKGKVQRNDVLLATTGGGVLGKTYYFDEEGEFLASTDVAYLRVDTSKLLAKFLYYCLTINYIMFNDLMANGSTNQTHFDMPSLFNMFLPLPNIKTQNIIIDYLDKKCLEIEDIITKKKQQLEILNQYKKSMIYEYVTGKKEVCT